MTTKWVPQHFSLNQFSLLPDNFLEEEAVVAQDLKIDQISLCYVKLFGSSNDQ